MLFKQKQKYLENNKGKKDSTLDEINDKFQSEISEAKSKSFQDFASELNHTNRNKDVFRAMKYVGSRRPSRIAELTIQDKDGKTVTSSQEKANLLSARYQVPLGYHPKRDAKRKEELKQKRSTYEQ